MLPTVWKAQDPFRDLWAMIEPALAPTAAARWMPAADVIEDGDATLIRMDVPGLQEDDLRVEAVDGILTLAGSRADERAAERGGYRRVERVSGRFERRFRLPEGADADAITARLERGVLEVRVPKPAEAEPRRIAINGAQPALDAGEPAETG